MIVSGKQWRDSATRTHVSVSPKLPLRQAAMKYWTEFPVLSCTVGHRSYLAWAKDKTHSEMGTREDYFISINRTVYTSRITQWPQSLLWRRPTAAWQPLLTRVARGDRGSWLARLSASQRPLHLARSIVSYLGSGRRNPALSLEAGRLRPSELQSPCSTQYLHKKGADDSELTSSLSILKRQSESS